MTGTILSYMFDSSLLLWFWFGFCKSGLEKLAVGGIITLNLIVKGIEEGKDKLLIGLLILSIVTSCEFRIVYVSVKMSLVTLHLAIFHESALKIKVWREPNEFPGTKIVWSVFLQHTTHVTNRKGFLLYLTQSTINACINAWRFWLSISCNALVSWFLILKNWIFFKHSLYIFSLSNETHQSHYERVSV